MLLAVIVFVLGMWAGWILALTMLAMESPAALRILHRGRMAVLRRRFRYLPRTEG